MLQNDDDDDIYIYIYFKKNMILKMNFQFKIEQRIFEILKKNI